jgi:predicted PurR-regulated permease PerM
MARILLYLPMEDKDERLLLEKLTTSTRATLKGTLVIGIIQGGLAGAAFKVAGIPNAVFWGAVMAVLSLVPNIGSALVWLPASVVLMLQGEYIQGTGLLLFCSLVVGSVDNFLRPVLVGKETEVHELMIFLSTLGGLALFGFIGLILGPVIAAVFTALWEMYGIAFKDVLPSPDGISPGPVKPGAVIDLESESCGVANGAENEDEPDPDHNAASGANDSMEKEKDYPS